MAKASRKGVWIESFAAELDEIALKARSDGVGVHFGNSFGFMVEKNYESGSD